MRTRQVIELAVGTGLLLGPLVYALTLDGAPAAECTAELAEPAPVIVVEALPEVEVAERCDQPEVVEPVEVVEVAEPEPKPEGLAEFLFVTDAGLVLSAEAERSWGTGRLFEPPGEVSYRAAKRADPTKVPTELWSMRGRSFDLYGADGKLCTARLGELRVIGQFDGWSVGGLLGDEWYEEDPEGASKTEIRKALWARDDLWLVAEIASDQPCKGALWARDAELPPPALLRRSDEANSASEARREIFQASEELAEAEREYREIYAELAKDSPESLEYTASWDTIVAENGLEIWSWVDVENRPQLVGFEFGSEGEGCGDPAAYSRLTALDFVRADGFESVEHGHTPAAIFDADGDGQFELLYEDWTTTAWLVSETIEQSVAIEEDFMCPC